MKNVILIQTLNTWAFSYLTGFYGFLNKFMGWLSSAYFTYMLTYLTGINTYVPMWVDAIPQKNNWFYHYNTSPK